MAKKDKVVVGIDLGATKMLVGVLKGRKVLATVKAKTDPAGGEGEFFATIAATVARALADAGLKPSQLAAVGAGCPGVLDYRTDRIVSSANIPFIKDYPLARKLEKLFKVPAAVENDANMGLYGEQQFGAAAGCEHVAGFFLGTGIGGALILDGKLYRGSSGAAGELGHIFVDPLGPGCGCGNRGCLEALAGRLALAGEAAALAARGGAPRLHERGGRGRAQAQERRSGPRRGGRRPPAQGSGAAQGRLGRAWPWPTSSTRSTPSASCWAAAWWRPWARSSCPRPRSPCAATPCRTSRAT